MGGNFLEYFFFDVFDWRNVEGGELNITVSMSNELSHFNIFYGWVKIIE